MGQWFTVIVLLRESYSSLLLTKAKKAASMKTSSKATTKGAMTKALAEEFELKQKQCSEIIESFVAIATTEVKKNGIFTIPGLCRIKTRVKPATKAGVRNIFGKE